MQNAPGGLLSSRFNPMAIVTTINTPIPKFVPIIGVGENQWSQIPRASVDFFTGVVAIPVATGGDTQKVEVNMVLNQGYSYALSDLTFLLWGVDVADWDSNAFCAWTNADSATEYADLALHNEGQNAHQPGKTYHLEAAPPSRLMYHVDNGGKLQIVLTNTSIDGTSMSARAFARFWVYDINQSWHYGVNTPTLTR